MARRTGTPVLLASAMLLLFAAAPDPNAALLPLWNAMPDRAGWQMLVSPAFPAEWPPRLDARGGVVRYAFAMRLKPGVADGAEMTAPWAMISQDVGGGTVATRLSPRLQPIGIQGVRPLDRAEIALIGREQEVMDRLLVGGNIPDDGLVRSFTCGWIGRLGVVAAEITPRHPAFVHWLDCR